LIKAETLVSSDLLSTSISISAFVLADSSF